jgi:6-phosphogluconolactonase
MLSGGQTPMAAYQAIAASPMQPAKNLHLFFSDERMVPVDSPDSNYHNTQAMLDGLGFDKSRILRVRTEFSLEMAAADYDEQLRKFLAGGGQIPLGLLGLGTDGHTASLFSREDIERSGGSYAIAVPRPAPPHRVSVTPRLLGHIKRIVFLAADSDKAMIVDRLIREPESIPAGLAVKEATHVELWVTE